MKKKTLISVFAVAMMLTGCSNANENKPSGDGSSVTSTITQPEQSAPPQSSESPRSTEASAPPQSSESPKSTEASVPPQSSESPRSTETSAPPQSSDTPKSTETSAPPQSPESPKSTETSAPPVQSSSTSSQTQTPSQPNESSQPETLDKKEELVYMMNIKIGENVLMATLEHNSSAEALLKLLSDGPVTIRMSDYGSMEKVGTLPERLPRNDEQIDTDACDLILYQGNQFVIYYDTNSWSLTRLGRINNITQSELKKILGKGDVTVTLSRVS